MSKASKKERHKARREAKKAQLRRQEAMSPAKRLGQAPGPVECWMSAGLEVHGQAHIYAFKRAGGLSGVACFLVDEGVVGLKDAFMYMDVDRVDFLEMIDSCKKQGIAMQPVPLEKAKQLIAGGLRWAHDNGMRLPKEWTKTATIIGGLGDWTNADVSPFVKEFAGHPEDLRRRLIGEAFETYIRRKDVSFVFSDSAPVMDQETGAYLNTGLPFDDLDDQEDEKQEIDLDAVVAKLLADGVLQIAEKQVPPVAGDLTAVTLKWLADQNETPSPELERAWRGILLATFITAASMPHLSNDEDADLVAALLEAFVAQEEQSRQQAFSHGMDQALRHLSTNPMMMRQAAEKQAQKEEQYNADAQTDHGLIPQTGSLEA
ncbi:MAG TPA: hypothetical protein VMD30_07625 [Tepidisphaeraceae bacterium]|nr:hypothetical protein [Tepidisphaeraceae bacterium]